jgi:GH25 family lysozyme M1 (1,4-beta-N-acetylmuramidase)
VSERLVDVSEHQGDIDWGKAAREIDGAFVRVSDGDVRDRFYSKGRVEALRRENLPFGSYYYARVASPGNKQRSGAAECRMAVGFAKDHGWGRRGDLRFAYDYEEANDQPLGKAARHLVDFVSTFEEREGYHPILYTMPGFWNEILDHLEASDRRLLKRCPLWIAHWGVERPARIAPWDGDYAIHQHSDHGRVAGISGPVDVDRARVALKELTIGTAK